MEITDLQIGDYVAFKDNSTICYKVVGLYSNGDIYAQNLVTGAIFENDIDSIVGIKITKSILKKNGWINDLYSILPIDENKYLQYYWYENRLRCIWNGVDEYENHSEVTDIIFQCGGIKYVHELQHALKLCGLTDSKFDLKI